MDNKAADTKKDEVVFTSGPPAAKSNPTQPETAPTAPKTETATSNVIPEEYLTDEDLYPAQTSDGGSKVKKKLPLLIIAIVAFIFIIGLVLLLGRLFSGNSNPNEPVKLTFWGLWQSPQVMNELIKDYQKNNPYVEIEYVQMDAKDNYRERLLERTRNGTGPDLFRFHNTWVPSIKELLSIAPQTIYTAEDFGQIYYPVMVKDLVIDNQVIGVPYNLDGLVLLYNEDLLKNAGINQPPMDWELLISDAKQITVRDDNGNVITAGVALGAAENISHFSDILGLMFLQNNVTLKDLESNANAQTVIETYLNFVLNAEPSWSEIFDNSINAFAEEKVAMIFVPTWEIEVIKHLNPDLALKVAKVPQIRGGSQKNLANYWADAVSRGSKHQKQAWDFLKFLSQKEQQSRMFELETKSGRMFGNIYPRMDMAELLIDHEYLGPLVKDANILDSIPMVSRTYDNGLNDEIVNYYLKDSINSVLLGTSVFEAVRNLNLGVTQVLQKYGL